MHSSEMDPSRYQRGLLQSEWCLELYILNIYVHHKVHRTKFLSGDALRREVGLKLTSPRCTFN